MLGGSSQLFLHHRSLALWTTVLDFGRGVALSRTYCAGPLPLPPPALSIEELYKKDLHNPDNPDDGITNLEPDILECEVKWALESITTNKASGGNGIPVELFQVLKDDAVKMLHSICQQICKTQL